MGIQLGIYIFQAVSVVTVSLSNYISKHQLLLLLSILRYNYTFEGEQAIDYNDPCQLIDQLTRVTCKRCLCFSAVIPPSHGQIGYLFV